MTHFIDTPAKVLIVAIEQPPEGYILDGVLPNEGNVYFIRYKADEHGYDVFKTPLPLPLGAKVGVRTVSSVVVKQVKELTAEEIEYLPNIPDLAANAWVEVVGLEDVK